MMRIYQQAVSKEKRAAQDVAFSDLFSERAQSNPPAPNPRDDRLALSGFQRLTNPLGTPKTNEVV
jgi:hypothetical protein